MPNNIDDYDVETGEEVHREPPGSPEGQITVVDEVGPRVAAEVWATLGGIRQSRFSDFVAQYQSIPVMRLLDGRYRVGTIRREEYDLSAVSWHDMVAHDTHETQDMTEAERGQDRVFRDAISRWVDQQLTTAEMRLLSCPCNGCVRAVYDEAVRRVPVPSGYARDCTCLVCVAWRVRVHGEILNVARGDMQMASGLNITRRIVLDGARSEAFPLATEATREAARAMRQQTAFERRRERRGHPVVKQELAPDWKPNAWEA